MPQQQNTEALASLVQEQRDLIHQQELLARSLSITIESLGKTLMDHETRIRWVEKAFVYASGAFGLAMLFKDKLFG